MRVSSSGGSVGEPPRKTPVLYDVDVAVAGSGIAGAFAAIAAARAGARTLVIDRFGAVGGNIGPGWVNNGSWNTCYEIPEGYTWGIQKEMYEAVRKLQAVPSHGNEWYPEYHRMTPSHGLARYPEQAHIVSHVAMRMMEAAGVEFLLNAFVSDPILEGNRVCGVFVETCSGRVAVRARVVIDGTGQALVAARAGAPMVYKVGDIFCKGVVLRHYTHPEHENWNDTELFYLMGDVNLEAHKRFRERAVALRGRDAAFARRQQRDDPEWNVYNEPHAPAVTPVLRRAAERGEFLHKRFIGPHVMMLSKMGDFRDYGGGIAGAYVWCGGVFDLSDAKQMTHIERTLRLQAFDTVQFLRRRMPGFERAYLLATPAFIGARGGPFIEGEHVLTPQEMVDGARFDDALFRDLGNPIIRRYLKQDYPGDPTGHDVPYRMILPKKVDGLLVIGRGAAYLRRGHDPGGGRRRSMQMHLGEAAGTAAAMAVRRGVVPRRLDVRALQRRLIRAGFPIERRRARAGSQVGGR